MKTHLLILGLLFVCAMSTEDAADTLASRFIFKSDADRRLMIDFTFRNNPTQVFQLAYGLKRQKLYDLLRAYLHPNIVNIVLYGSYSFFIQLNRDASWNGNEPYTGSGSANPLTGYYLSAHRYFDQDKRSEQSTYTKTLNFGNIFCLNFMFFGWGAKRWRLTPVASTYSGTAFYISLVADEHKYDGVDQTGWFLSLQRLVSFDKIGEKISHVLLVAPPCQSNIWTLTPVDRGESFVITLAYDDNQYDGISQTGFSLDYINNMDQERRSRDTNGFDDSYYTVAINKNDVKYGAHKSWEITFAGS